jgi:hypothetical protein
MFDPISEANLNHQSTLASLAELNHSLRQQVVDLLLSIAVLKETQGLPPSAMGFAKVHEPLKRKTRGQQSLRRYDRQL